MRRFSSSSLRYVTPLVTLLMLCGCGGSKPSANSITMLIESSPTTLDPRVGTDAQAERLDGLLYDGLVRRDAHFGIAPELASRWEVSPDGLTYTFHLRPGVRFSNGAPLTARDVKWSLDTSFNGAVLSVKSGSFTTWKSVEAPDPLTVIVHLKKADTTLLWNICNGVFGVIPYGSGRDFWRHPVGSGPFELVSQEQDRDVITRRNPYYWGPRPNVDEVRYSVVPDAITRALELQKGSADVAENEIPPDMLATLARNPHLRVESSPGTVVYYMIFNLRDHYLADLRVREAIAGAIDRKLIIKTLFDGRARLANSVLPPEHWAWTGDVEQHPFDPAKANALLDAAGYRRGADGVRFHITLKSSTDESTRLECSVLQAQLQKIGIALDLRTYEFATFYSDVTRGAFQMAPSRWIGGNEAPAIFTLAYSSASMPPHGANRGFYTNKTVDAMLDETSASSDRAVQTRDFRVIQQQLAHDLPVFYLWYADTVAVANRRISPLSLSPAGNFDFMRTVSVVDTAR